MAKIDSQAEKALQEAESLEVQASEDPRYSLVERLIADAVAVGTCVAVGLTPIIFFGTLLLGSLQMILAGIGMGLTYVVVLTPLVTYLHPSQSSRPFLGAAACVAVLGCLRPLALSIPKELTGVGETAIVLALVQSLIPPLAVLAQFFTAEGLRRRGVRSSLLANICAGVVLSISTMLGGWVVLGGPGPNLLSLIVWALILSGIGTLGGSLSPSLGARGGPVESMLGLSASPGDASNAPSVGQNSQSSGQLESTRTV